jgi:hypothetical protein
VVVVRVDEGAAYVEDDTLEHGDSLHKMALRRRIALVKLIMLIVVVALSHKLVVVIWNERDFGGEGVALTAT